MEDIGKPVNVVLKPGVVSNAEEILLPGAGNVEDKINQENSLATNFIKMQKKIKKYLFKLRKNLLNHLKMFDCSFKTH